MVDFFSFPVFLDYISPFNVCCKAGLVLFNFLNFCLSGKLFTSPSVLNEILSRSSNLCRFFHFSILNMYCHSLLACRVSPERSAVKHMGFPLYATCCFSLVAFNSLGWMHETSAQGWCTRMTQRDWMGREVGGGFRMGNTCKSMADSCQCMAKPTTIL